MNQPPTTDLTQKAERTRQRILDTALDLFVTQGYERTTLRDIAAAAQCSLGLTYRYFARKEDLVLVLYNRLALELEAHVETLPSDRLADRFYTVMQAHLKRLEPSQDALAALFGSALSPRSGIGVLGVGTADVRERVSAAFLALVSEASDAPGARQARDLAIVLFGAHLGLILFWLQDQSQGRRITQEVLVFTRDLLALLRPLLRVPPASRMLARLARLIEPVLSPGTRARAQDTPGSGDQGERP
jgi:AcrR family transcriptional regulator